MEKQTMVIDGKRFINEEFLVRKMVEVCTYGTSTNDVVVYEGESDTVCAYLELIDRMNIPEIKNRFRGLYVQERFIKRTTAV